MFIYFRHFKSLVGWLIPGCLVYQRRQRKKDLVAWAELSCCHVDKHAISCIYILKGGEEREKEQEQDKRRRKRIVKEKKQCISRPFLFKNSNILGKKCSLKLEIERKNCNWISVTYRTTTANLFDTAKKILVLLKCNKMEETFSKRLQRVSLMVKHTILVFQSLKFYIPTCVKYYSVQSHAWKKLIGGLNGRSRLRADLLD